MINVGDRVKIVRTLYGGSQNFNAIGMVIAIEDNFNIQYTVELPNGRTTFVFEDEVEAYSD